MAEAVFQLMGVVDSALFYGFDTKARSILGKRGINTISGEDSIRNDFYPDLPYTWNWKTPKLGELWKPIEVFGDVKSFNDYPRLGEIPAFNERSYCALEDMLVDNGELLPFSYEGKTFYAYNCNKICEILDHFQTKGLFGSDYSPLKNRLTTASSISYFGVIKEKLTGLSIFKMRELPNRVYVTDTFVKAVRANGLNGFEFMKVWPLTPGTDVLSEHLAWGKSNFSFEQCCEKLGISGIKKAILEFKVPQVDAQKTGLRLKKELNVLLQIRQLDCDMFGRVKRKQQYEDGVKFHMICLDYDLLWRKIDPWIESTGLEHQKHNLES